MLLRISLLAILSVFSMLKASEIGQNIGTHRIPQFENEHVKVWKTVIMPHDPLKMHRHAKPRIVVGLKGGTLTKIEESGEVSQLDIETGKAYWFDEDPQTLHGDLNESDEPIEVMLIEFKNINETSI